jgi:molecular chaperone GrpE
MKNNREKKDDRGDGAAVNETAEAAPERQDTEKLAEALEQKTKEAAEANEKFLRTYADFDNYRKRMQRDLADFRKYANEQMALELLSVVDHLGLALKHSQEAGEPSQALRQGVELVYKQLRDVLEKFGIKQFAAEGEQFDPAKHEAMMQVVTDDVPDNTVVQVLQDGYLYHDKILRHAKVSVSKKPQPETVPAQEQ